MKKKNTEKKLKILLVWPPKNDYDIPEAPPLGLLYLAAVLRKKHDIWLVDFNALKYSWKDVETRLKKEKPDLLGIGATTVTYDAMIRIAKLARKIIPDTKIMIGGPQVSAYAKKAKEDTSADYVLVGESEQSVWEIIDYYNKGETGKIIKGKRIEDLDKIPFPAIDLLEPALTYYQGNLPRYAYPETMMLWSRGCPFSCFFCSDVIYHGQKPRFRSPENIVAEIKRLKDLGFKSIFVYDDDLVGINKQQFEWLESVCKLIIKEKLNDIVYKCQGRASRFVQLSTLQLMKKAGFRVIMWGCESGSDRVLKNLRKGTTKEDIKRTIALCKKARLDAWMFLIIGNYTETKEDAEMTLQMVKDVKPTHVQVTYCTPYPSEYEKFAIKNNLIIQQDRSKWDTNEPVVKPDSMSLEDAKYYHDKIIDITNKTARKEKSKKKLIEKIESYKLGRYARRTAFYYKNYGIKITLKKILQKIRGK